MPRCHREDTVFGGCLSKQVPNAKLIATVYFFFKKDTIPVETKHQRKLACHVFQMHHFTHRTDKFFLLFLEEIGLGSLITSWYSVRRNVKISDSKIFVKPVQSVL